jgi:hypothetical protein
MLSGADGADFADQGADEDWCKQQQQQQWEVEPGQQEPTDPSQQQQQQPEEGNTDTEGESLPVGHGLLESQSQKWLQQLALLLPLQTPPASITLGELRQQLPVPQALVRQHNTDLEFMRRAPGLRWTAGKGVVSIEPMFHHKLRTAAGKGGGTRGVSGGDLGLTRQHSAAMSAAETADGASGSSRGRSWAGSFPQQQPQQWQQQLQMLTQAQQAEVWQWLQQLALLLRNPVKGRSFAAVQREAPFSASLMDIYGGARGTISSLPGVYWDESDNTVRMDPQMHAELRASAAAAAGRGGVVGAGGQQRVGPLGQGDLDTAQGSGLSVQQQQQQQSLQQAEGLGSSRWCQGTHHPPPLLLPLLQQGGLGGAGSANWGRTLQQQQQQSRCWQQLQALPLPVQSEAVAWLQQLSHLLEAHGPARGISWAIVQRNIPLPEQLMRFFKGAHGMLHSLPGLLYDTREHVVRLYAVLHRELQLKAAAAAAAAAAGGGGGTGGPASMQQQQQREVPTHVEADMQAWLQRLALLLPYERPPVYIHIQELQSRLPVPQSVLDHYNGVARFVQARRGLIWNGPRDHVSLGRKAHQQLLSAAAAASGISMGTGMAGPMQQPKLVTGSAGQQQQQQQFQQQQLPRELQVKLRGWLRQLALLLKLPLGPNDPPASMSFYRMKTEAPIPDCLVQHYRSVSAVIGSIPGLIWDGDFHHRISIDPELHRGLRSVRERSNGAHKHSNIRMQPAGLLAFVEGRVWHADNQQLDTARRALVAHMVRQANPDMDGGTANINPDAYIIPSGVAGGMPCAAWQGAVW